MKAQDQVMAKEYMAEQAAAKAKEEAEKISQTAVPNAQGKIELPTYLQASAVGKPTEEQVTTPAPAAPVAEQQVTTPAPIAEPPAAPAALTKENVAAAYAANDVSTEKVRKALEPQLIEMGLDTKEEQKAYLKTIQAELGIPTIDPKASGIEKIKQARAKDQWKANILTQQEAQRGIENVQPPARIDAAANKLGAPSAPPAVGEPTTRIDAPDLSRVVGTGRDATTDNVAEAAQPDTLEEKPDRPEIVQQRTTLERVLPKNIGNFTLGAITPYAGNWTVNYTSTNESGMVYSTNVPIDAEMLEGKTDAEIETAIRERAAKNGLRLTIQFEHPKLAFYVRHTPQHILQEVAKYSDGTNPDLAQKLIQASGQ
jgi:hypothetical protein